MSLIATEFITPISNDSMMMVAVAALPSTQSLEGGVTIRVDGVPTTTIYMWEDLGFGVYLFPCNTSISAIQIEVVSPIYSFDYVVLEVDGERHVPPYAYSDVTSTSLNHDVPAYTGESVLGYLMLVMTTDSPNNDLTLIPPAGWTVLGGALYGWGATVIAYRQVVPGANAAETWATDTGPAVYHTQAFTIQFYDLGLVVRPAIGIAQLFGGQLLAPGHTEQPPGQTPFEEETNPIPEYTPVRAVPLPPWIEQTGQFRGN